MGDKTQTEKRGFALELAKNTSTHGEWVALMKFGQATLLKDQRLLIDLVIQEVERECERAKAALMSRQPDKAGIMHTILQELGLELALWSRVQKEAN